MNRKPIEEILMLCDEQIDELESREIDGVMYRIVDWASIDSSRITNKLRRAISKGFCTDRFTGMPPAIFFVCDVERRQFYFGLWDTELHKPVHPEPLDSRNADYSYILDLFFPEKETRMFDF